MWVGSRRQVGGRTPLGARVEGHKEIILCVLSGSAVNTGFLTYREIGLTSQIERRCKKTKIQNGIGGSNA